MGVSINQLMKIPVLKDAEVIAGNNGLDNIAEAVSVSEGFNEKILNKSNNIIGKKDYSKTKKFVSITGFTGIGNNVDMQVDLIKKLHQEGSVAIIIFYVGIIINEIDEKVINIANDINMPLICMPTRGGSNRYTTVIREILESIIDENNANENFAFEIIEKVSLLKKENRNLDSVLSFLSKKLTCSIIVTDSLGNIVSNSFCFTDKEKNAKIISHINKFNLDSHFNNSDKINHAKETYYLTYDDIFDTNRVCLRIFVVKRSTSIPKEIFTQMIEVIKTSIHIWNQKYGTYNSDELVFSIIKNETINIKRLLKTFHIKPSELTSFCIFSHKLNTLEITSLKNILSPYFRNFIVGNYDLHTIMLLPKIDIETTKFAKQILDAINTINNKTYTLAIESNMNELSSTNKYYTLFNTTCEYANTIFPKKDVISMSELCIISEMLALINRNNSHKINDITYIIENIKKQPKGEYLADTLEVFFLDAASNYKKTAQIQFSHVNSVKYRINKVREICGFDILKLPYSYELYRACILSRLIKHISSGNIQG